MNHYNTGIRNRWDRSTPSGVDAEREREQSKSGGIQFSPLNTRFCETCQRHIKVSNIAKRKPRAFKGWKCKDCRRFPI